MIRGVNVIDGFSPYSRNEEVVLSSMDFRTFEFPEATFHGIHPVSLDSLIPKLLAICTGGTPSLSFMRKSPLGQAEPHFIHTDIDMGQWSAVLFLNAAPPAGDGTTFWTRSENGAIESTVPHQFSEVGKSSHGWTVRETVPAQFNRLIVFPSSYFHSRAIFNNWGTGTDARLTHITFGTGDIFA